ncbi:cysteine protease StiP family protein [Desulforamulus aeronauticus]|uniref:PELOTA RNA binding domain-containing protein n=1 Tax=Desulforamulus aeronauticus DSM 10349 TaxID=1121421 RepID=A0A1M6NBM1_9FIRM|nr:PELOTA RNA binding domain-containing protein [Desulforamulus aeronauticus DSM 10349]
MFNHLKNWVSNTSYLLLFATNLGGVLINSATKCHAYGSLKNYPKVPSPEPLGSYPPGDAIFLLKDIAPSIQEQGNEERERAIQSGRHYSEMLPIEYEPSQEYIDLFHRSLLETGQRLALATAIVSETILKKRGKGVVLVSLARAGTPIGVLVKKYIYQFHGIDVPHYSISIIRDKGIDKNALAYILQNHPGCEIQFIDGWTGKGAITTELIKSVTEFEKEFNMLPDTISKELAVLADPGCCANIFGTRDDFLIPSACLNSTVSGLMSRTVCREDLIGPIDFHGAKFYRELLDKDLSNYFVDTVASYFLDAQKKALIMLQNKPHVGIDETPAWLGKKETTKVQMEFGIHNINYVKPGVGETTRVLLRRVPWKILVKDMKSADIKHVLLLAEDRGVPVEEYPELSYSCYGLIKNLEDTK